MGFIYERLKQSKNRNSPTDYYHARQTIAGWTRDHIVANPNPSEPHRVLDIGLGWGDDLRQIRQSCADLNVAYYGIENQEHLARQARDEGIETFPLDIEREPIPLPDEFFSVVLSNQVIEHTKELFWIFSEVSRVLKKGGIAIIGCPNLGSWHNRVALLFGQQPPCMPLLGPHVRGITLPSFRQLIEHSGYFELVTYKGTCFYPFPPSIDRVVSRVAPTLCANLTMLIRRTAKPGRYLDVLDSGVPGLDNTPYFRGP
jgi:ubiquinone/menaquinone biosynthesis C-methylase UbiE